MNGDYSIFNNSMNGVITLSDGVSFISDGQAQHENIIYTNFVKSEDEATILTNDTLTTVDITATNINATNITANAETLGTLTVTNLNVDNYGFYVNGFSNTISSSLPTTMNNTLKIVGNEFTLENGNINQIGTTSTNTLKTTSINGTLTCQSDLVQTGGNTVLKNITCDNLTMNSNKSITQTGSGVSNSLGSTTVSDLVVTSSMTFPSTVTIPSATQNGDLSFTNGARIIQDLTQAGTNYNTLMYSKLAKLDVTGNITQTSGTATLLNTTIQGTAEIQGNITQTSGQSVFKAIGCDQLSLNANKDLFFSNGTGKIDQSVSTGTNAMSAITMNANTNLTLAGTGIVSQTGTGTNALKNTSITGTLAVSSTSTFTGNVTCNGSLSMGANRSITQPTGTTNNQFQATTISNLTCPTATITDITATTLSVGNVSNQEIQYLDGVTSSIQNQINNINATTSGNSTSLTGISYTAGTDTTLIDNNVTIPVGKTLAVGSISDVGTNIGSLNTSVTNLNTSVNTLTTNFNNVTSGMTYTGGATDRTTFDNNVTINKTLLVQGMDIKAEIDALETTFTTGTLNSTSATIANLNTTNINNSNEVVSRFFVPLDSSISPSKNSIIYQSNTSLIFGNPNNNSSYLFSVWNNIGGQIIPLTMDYIGAVFNVPITCANIVVNTVATITSAIITNLTATTITATNITSTNSITSTNTTSTNLTTTNITATTITSPSTGNINITASSGNDMLINAYKGTNAGNVFINSGSFNSNTYIDNGDLIVDNNVSVNNGYVSTSNCKIKEMTSYVGTASTDVKTHLIADYGKSIISSHTYCGAWMINDVISSGVRPNNIYPILCSLRKAGYFDDLFVLAGGYKLVLYRQEEYAIFTGSAYNYYIAMGDKVWSGSNETERQTRTIDNTNGTTWLTKTSVEVCGFENSVGSVKLYYYGNEITLPYLS